DVLRAWMEPRGDLLRTLARQRKQRARVRTPRRDIADGLRMHDTSVASRRGLSSAARKGGDRHGMEHPPHPPPGAPPGDPSQRGAPRPQRRAPPPDATGDEGAYLAKL